MNEEARNMFRVGIGYDVHRLAEGRRCVIGGVDIPHERGLLGHSDADVLLHALADAILGAIGEGDIGKHFPDTDPEFKDADSLALLRHVWKLAVQKGYTVGNADMVVVAERPKLLPHIPVMKERISAALQCAEDQLNIKATTSEKLGFVGREEGISAHAVVSLVKTGK